MKDIDKTELKIVEDPKDNTDEEPIILDERLERPTFKKRNHILFLASLLCVVSLFFPYFKPEDTAGVMTINLSVMKKEVHVIDTPSLFVVLWKNATGKEVENYQPNLRIMFKSENDFLRESSKLLLHLFPLLMLYYFFQFLTDTVLLKRIRFLLPELIAYFFTTLFALKINYDNDYSVFDMYGIGSYLAGGALVLAIIAYFVHSKKEENQY